MLPKLQKKIFLVDILKLCSKLSHFSLLAVIFVSVYLFGIIKKLILSDIFVFLQSRIVLVKHLGSLNSLFTFWILKEPFSDNLAPVFEIFSIWPVFVIEKLALKMIHRAQSKRQVLI
jgi:hypothetical protein